MKITEAHKIINDYFKKKGLELTRPCNEYLGLTSIDPYSDVMEDCYNWPVETDDFPHCCGGFILGDLSGFRNACGIPNATLKQAAACLVHAMYVVNDEATTVFATTIKQQKMDAIMKLAGFKAIHKFPSKHGDYNITLWAAPKPETVIPDGFSQG